jgi:FKBP12-rapamycin complex-associated protein
LLQLERVLIHQRLGPERQFDSLRLLHKVSVFEDCLSLTTGQDLRYMVWLESDSAEIWLKRRTNFSRSLAVMSMVGYILGLGDRHPCNLMLDQISGKIIHIDFGDCFDVAILREKFPETVPFRLTRMLVNALEVSGIEGTFRIISELVMKTMRENKESVMAVLEAFVHDPLINWRLLKTTVSPHDMEDVEEVGISDNDDDEKELGSEESDYMSVSTLSTTGKIKERMEAVGEDDQESEILREKGLKVTARISSKLTGKDFGNRELEVPEQVQRLICEATSLENLCRVYVGW